MMGDLEDDTGVYTAYYKDSGFNDFGIGAPFYSEADAQAYFQPNPALLVSIDGMGLSGGAPKAEGEFIYNLELVAPASIFSPIVVPVYETFTILGENLPDDPQGPYYAEEGSVLVYSAYGDLTQFNICGLMDGCSGTEAAQKIVFDNQIFLQPGLLYGVTLDASIELTGSSGSPFVGGVYVDPVFTIDPAFLAQNPGYSLEFSEGIGDSPDSAPEPATWAMMLAGFGGLGATMRRKRPTPP
jgi:hypothetical protein